MERRQITFRGRVQGVGFRATARTNAVGRAVTGWVRNQSNGTVLLEVQGSVAEIESYLESLRDRMGRLITGEDSSELPVASDEQGFEVRR